MRCCEWSLHSRYAFSYNSCALNQHFRYALTYDTSFLLYACLRSFASIATCTMRSPMTLHVKSTLALCVCLQSYMSIDTCTMPSLAMLSVNWWSRLIPGGTKRVSQSVTKEQALIVRYLFACFECSTFPSVSKLKFLHLVHRFTQNNIKSVSHSLVSA